MSATCLSDVFYCDETYDEEAVEFLRMVQEQEEEAREYMQSPAELTPSQAALAERIRQAFAGVTVGPEATLYLSGEAVACYQSAELQDELRRREIRDDWQSIPLPLLKACEHALSYVEAEGLRYLLPAWMLAELYYPHYATAGLELELSRSCAEDLYEEEEKDLTRRLDILSERQRDCVTDCIRELRLMECDESLKPVIAFLLPWEEEDRNARFPQLSAEEYAAQDLRRYCERHSAAPGRKALSEPTTTDEQEWEVPGMDTFFTL